MPATQHPTSCNRCARRERIASRLAALCWICAFVALCLGHALITQWLG